MGLLHSRASKKRDRAEAALLREERRGIKRDRQVTEAGSSVIRQPTVRDAVMAWLRR